MGRAPPWSLPAMGKPGVVAGVAGVVVEVEVAEVSDCTWKGPQPLRRAAAKRENGR
jgi:hypothetical protein